MSLTIADLDAAIERGIAEIRQDPQLVSSLVATSTATALDPETVIRAAAAAALLYGSDAMTTGLALMDQRLAEIQERVMDACRQARLTPDQLRLLAAALKPEGTAR